MLHSPDYSLLVNLVVFNLDSLLSHMIMFASLQRLLPLSSQATLPVKIENKHLFSIIFLRAAYYHFFSSSKVEIPQDLKRLAFLPLHQALHKPSTSQGKSKTTFRPYHRAVLPSNSATTSHHLRGNPSRCQSLFPTATESASDWI